MLEASVLVADMRGRGELSLAAPASGGRRRKIFSSRSERRDYLRLAQLRLDRVHLLVDGSDVVFEIAANVGDVACDGRKPLLDDGGQCVNFLFERGVLLFAVAIGTSV